MLDVAELIVQNRPLEYQMKISVKLFGCGSCVAPNAWCTTVNPTPYRLYYVRNGDAYFRLSNGEFKLKHGHFYLFPSSLPFLIRQDSLNRLDHLFYDFIMTPTVISSEPICVSLDDHPLFSHFLTIMTETVEDWLEQESSDSFDTVCHTLEAFLSILFTVKPVRIPSDDAVIRTIEYMESHISERVNIKEIADSLYLSEDYLIRKFKKVTGLTPYAYLSRLRLSVAQSLIDNGVSLKDAAEQTGFQYSSSLIHSLKKHGK